MARRGYYNRGRDYDSDSISLIEFRFYNQKKKVIDVKVLNSIEKEFEETINLLKAYSVTQEARNLNHCDMGVLNSIFRESKYKSISEHLGVDLKTKTFWTNKTFAEHHIGFKFVLRQGEVCVKILDYTPKDEYDNTRTKKKKEIVKFTEKEFCNVKDMFGKRLFFNFELTEKQSDALNNLKYNNDYVFNDFQICNSWDEFLNYLIIEKKFESYEMDYTDSFNMDVKTLFGIQLDEVNEEKQYKILEERRRVSVYHILEVIEKRINNKNYRIAFLVKHGYGVEFKIATFSEEDKEYNYIDKNRLFLRENNNNRSRYYFVDLSLNYYDAGKLIINMDLFSSMLNNIGEILRDDELVISPTIYNFYNQRASTFSGKDYLSQREMEIVNQYIKLIKKGKKIKFGDIIITKKKIEILGQNFTIRFNDKFFKLSEDFSSIRKALNIQNARFNFNRVYENLLNVSVIKIIKQQNAYDSDYKSFKEVEFQVNKIKIKIEKINSRMRINGVACRIDDVYYLLTKAICYNTQEEFDKYVKDVSYIGVEWKKMICDGLMLQLTNPFKTIFKKTGETELSNMYMRFSLLWDAEKRSSVYLLLNGQKYLIKYKGKFKKHFNYPQRTLSLEDLKTELVECLEDISDKAILEIVDNAIEEAKIVQKRGEELVANTIKDIQAMETTMEVEGNEMIGYKFKGRLSGVEYFIHKTSLDVFKRMDGHWNRRCVVDDHTKQRIFEDRLANRLVNIYNEPKKIFTLHGG